jgi:hypothetical protein
VPMLNDPAEKGWGAYGYNYGKKTFRNEEADCKELVLLEWFSGPFQDFFA